MSTTCFADEEDRNPAGPHTGAVAAGLAEPVTRTDTPHLAVTPWARTRLAAASMGTTRCTSTATQDVLYVHRESSTSHPLRAEKPLEGQHMTWEPPPRPMQRELGLGFRDGAPTSGAGELRRTHGEGPQETQGEHWLAPHSCLPASRWPSEQQSPLVAAEHWLQLPEYGRYPEIPADTLSLSTACDVSSSLPLIRWLEQ